MTMAELEAADQQLLADPATDRGCPVIVIRTSDGKREAIAHVHDAYEGWQIALGLKQGYAYSLTEDARLAKAFGLPVRGREHYKILTHKDFK